MADIHELTNSFDGSDFVIVMAGMTNVVRGLHLNRCDVELLRDRLRHANVCVLTLPKIHMKYTHINQHGSEIDKFNSDLIKFMGAGCRGLNCIDVNELLLANT